ncbi:MAG: ACP S-malonyltransferase [Coriobacteriia bacterium]|nr:ACP S-malonyltransferase [Coriobacteriia bacterium]
MAVTHAVVFPGQGSQRIGMLERLPGLDALDRLLDAAEALSGLNLRRIAAEGPAAALADTRAAQPLLYLVDWAWGTSLLAAGLEPLALAGHSVGEFAALAVAGAFSAEAGLELVVERADLMSSTAAATPGTMAAVLGLDSCTVADLVDSISDVWVANDNAPGQVIISGTHLGVESATIALSGAGARRIVPLQVAGPFHSPLMAPAADAFAAVLERTELSDVAIPILQNTDPAPTTDASVIATRLRNQMTSPVRWTETMYALRDMGVNVVVEAGPGAVLKGLARRVEGLDAFATGDGELELVVKEAR